MMKAYDLKELGMKLKDAGIPIAEEALEAVAKNCYLAVKEWAKESAPISSTPFDNFIAPFYDQLDAIVLPAIDKIDGEVG